MQCNFGSKSETPIKIFFPIAYYRGGGGAWVSIVYASAKYIWNGIQGATSVNMSFWKHRWKRHISRWRWAACKEGVKVRRAHLITLLPTVVACIIQAVMNQFANHSTGWYHCFFTHWSIARNIVKSKSNSEEHLKWSYTSVASVQMENYWFLKGVSPFPHHSANPMKKRIVKRHLVGGFSGC